jgi:YegS/Rv2252/BmrU family lipid kinase
MAVTSGPRDAARLAVSADGFDVVLVAGGDGTVHEVVNGIMAREEAGRPALAVLPSGSGDDYAKMLGLPDTVEGALGVLGSGKVRRLDVGLCNGVRFMNSLSLGLDARVTARVTQLQKTSAQTGLPLYLRGLFATLFRDYRTHDLAISVDGGELRRMTVMLVAVGIGPTYGGGFRIVPDAVPDDGLFDVLTIDGVPLAEALWRLPFVVTGRHLGMRPVHLTRARRIVVESTEPLAGQLDGETMEATRFDISIDPGALRVLVP